MRFFVGLLLAFGLSYLPLSAVGAQEDPPPAPGTTVSGAVINLTTGEPAPGGLSVMLHGWTASGEQLAMLHGESQPEGIFIFEDVQLLPDILYSAMAIYEDVTYFSRPSQLLDDGSLEPFRVEVYETTSSDDQVTIDQHHVFLGFDQGGLAVAEIYAISNSGDRAVKDAILLEDDRRATLQLPVPTGAANLTFPAASADRFIPKAGAIFDTKPLIPGARTGQVVVTYILQYEDELTLEHLTPYNTEMISVFLPHGSGLSLDSEAAEYLGVETFGDGQSYEAYTLGPSSAGDRIEISITGRPESVVSGMGSETLSESESGAGIALGIGVLGLTLIVTGIWWWRREGIASDDVPEENLEHEEEQGLGSVA